jgi:hypothetical protein
MQQELHAVRRGGQELGGGENDGGGSKDTKGAKKDDVIDADFKEV